MEIKEENQTTTNKIENNLNSIAKYQLSFDNFQVNQISFSSEEENVINTYLDTIELSTFRQIINAHRVGSYMLVLAGLRSLLESLITKVCVKNNINIIKGKDRNGNDIEIGLKRKMENIYSLIDNKSKNFGIMNNIRNYADSSLHFLEKKLKRKKDSDRYIRRFIELLKEEAIFKK